MVTFAIFNDKSLPFSNHDNPVEIFGILFKLLGELKVNNITTLRSSDDFKNYQITENENFQTFFGKISDRDFKTRLRSFITNKIMTMDNPLIKESENEQEHFFYSSEYKYNGQDVSSLGCADIWNTLAVSFYSNECWNKDVITVNKYSIAKNFTGSTEDTEIMHASKVEHLKTHNDYFEKLNFYALMDITQRSFFVKRETIFSKIHFCEEVESQIKKLPLHIFEAMLQILISIEKGEKQITSFKYSIESKTVRTNPKFIKQREFTLPEGEKVFFEKHLKSLPDRNRIYFLEKGSEIFIGYVGPHLDTKKY